MYMAEKATFDTIKPGDKIKRSGTVFYVVTKVSYDSGGYVRVKSMKSDRFDMIADKPQVWDRKDFDKRGFFMAQEPAVKVSRLTDSADLSRMEDRK